MIANHGIGYRIAIRPNPVGVRCHAFSTFLRSAPPCDQHIVRTTVKSFALDGLPLKARPETKS
jgi:hypothetical protein